MSKPPSLPRLLWQVAAGFAGLCLILVVMIFVALAALDRGWLDRPVASWASHKLGRTVRFERIEAHLILSSPIINIRGLIISNPAWAKGNVAEVSSLTAHVRFLPLLVGAIRVPDLAIDGITLHLIRLRSGVNNWTFRNSKPNQHAFAPLSGVGTMIISVGRLDLRDYACGLLFQARFAHHASGTRPFELAGHGILRGAGITLRGRGGTLNGRGAGPVYPFTAELIDGATVVDFNGHSSEPF